MSPFKYYYRPILELTFLFDRFVFSCSESFMHLDNIILHAINGVLVFFIVRKLVGLFGVSDNRHVPMFAALLFILHPINTESVNWISARTDVLAGTFVFLSFLMFIRKGMENFWWCLASAFIYLLGLLSKEVALGLLPVVGLFLTLKEKTMQELSIKKRLGLFLPFLLITFLYFLMRAVASGHSDLGIVAVAKTAESKNLMMSAGGEIKAFGFYIKKLFVPIPLNFGISEINRTSYLWFGTFALGGCLYLLFRRRTLPTFLFLLSVFFFLPAVPLAVSKMTWSPLAERYLYISSFGISSLVVLYLSRITWKELAYAASALLFIAAAVITVHRNTVWQSNLTLFEDTVRKSPHFGSAHNEYGVALARDGKNAEALEQFTIARDLSTDTNYEGLPTLNMKVPSLNILAMKMDHEKPEEIIEELQKLLEEKHTPETSVMILRELIRFLDSQALKEKYPTRCKALYTELISYTGRLFEVEQTGFNAYRIGQLHLALGEKKEAVEYFKKAVELSPNEYFSDPARKLIQRLDAKS